MQSFNPDLAKTLDVDARFTNYKVLNIDVADMLAIQEKARELALLMCKLCPNGHEITTAITLLEQSVMLANAGITRKGEPFNTYNSNQKGV